MDELYAALIAVLGSVFNTDYPVISNATFEGRPIFRGYTNNITVPTNGKYVVLTYVVDTNMSLNWLPYYNKTTHVNTYVAQVSSKVFIDFYGDTAQNNARALNDLARNGYVNTFWQINEHLCSIYKVKPVQNLSATFGRDMYNERFMLELEIFNYVISAQPIQYFDEVTLNIQQANRRIDNG